MRIFIFAILTAPQINLVCSKIYDSQIIDLTDEIKQHLDTNYDPPNIDSEIYDVVIVKPNKHNFNDDDNNVYSKNKVRRNAPDRPLKRISHESYDEKRDHATKLQEIINFLSDHYATTKYFYDEMVRITRTHEVKDKLRNIITYVEGYGRENLKNSLIECFEKLKIKHEKALMDMWSKHKLNKLVINVMGDPEDF